MVHGGWDMEALPAIEATEADLAAGQQRPEQHAGGIRAGQHAWGFAPLQGSGSRPCRNGRVPREASRETPASIARCRAGPSSPDDVRATRQRCSDASQRLQCRAAEPTSQPETVAPSLEGLPLARTGGDHNPSDRAAGFRRFIPPALQQTQQRLLIGRQLLQWMTFGSRNDTGDKPTRLAHLDHCYSRPERERPAQVVWLRHGAPRRFRCSDDDAVSLAARPIASLRAVRARRRQRLAYRKICGGDQRPGAPGQPLVGRNRAVAPLRRPAIRPGETRAAPTP